MFWMLVPTRSTAGSLKLPLFEGRPFQSPDAPRKPLSRQSLPVGWGEPAVVLHSMEIVFAGVRQTD